MSNFSNSEHHQASNAEHQPAQNNNFFSDAAFGGIDGFLNNGGASETFDHNWGFTPEQYNAAGAVGNSWQDAGSQQHMQQSTFRPGARPDQVFSSSTFANNLGAHTSHLGYGGSANNFAGFSQPQYNNTSTVSPSNLNNTAGNVPVRITAQQSNPSYGNTIAPEALQSRPYLQNNHIDRATTALSQHAQSPAINPQPRQYSVNVPQGDAVGSFLVLRPEIFRQTINSREISSYLDVGSEPFDFPVSKSAVPLYFPRKSRNEIKHLLASDSRLKARLNKKLSKKSGLTGSQTIPAQLDSSGKLTTQAPKKENESSSEVSSSDDSEYASSDEEDKEISPLPASRPTNPRDATRYDTIKCLWRSQTATVTAQSIREGLKDFHEILSTIKDRWKSDNNAVKQAEDAKKVNELPLLRERVKSQLDMLEAALKAAAEYGHGDILDHFGTSLPGVGAMAVFLQDRAREGDYTSSLVVAILQFISKCKLLDNGVLEKSAVGKLLPRFSRRGNDAVKAFAKRVENNAIAATKKKKEGSKSSGRSTSAEKDAKPDGGPKSPQQTAGTKRTRPADGPGEQPAKKVVSKPGEAQAAKKPGTTSAATSGKPAAPAVTKSSSFISSLQSAKRPVAKSATSQGKAAPNKPSLDSKPTASSAAGFSFASVLADVSSAKTDRPKEDRLDDVRPNESSAEREKRLRKEARRSLRVSFKPEDSLVEVRLFEHDPEEELGHDASQMRDVNDVGSEGKMFKLRQQHHEMMDIDDDEDELEEGSLEQSYKPWKQLRHINFDEIKEQSEQNYKPFAAGTLDPDCPEKAAQVEREAGTLLAVYSNLSEIPPSPKEPNPDAAGPPIDTKSFGAIDSINSRLEEVKQVQLQFPQELTASVPPTDIAAILKALAPQAEAPAAPTQPSIDQQVNLANLMSGLGGASMQPPQPAAPPIPPSNYAGQPAPAPDMSAIFAGLGNQNQQQSQQPAQPPPDIAAILASLHGTQQQSAAPPLPQMQPTFPNLPGMPAMGQFNPQDQQQAWQMGHQFAMAGMPNMWQQQAQQQQEAPFENEQRKRWREQTEEADGNGNKRQKNDKQPNPSQFYKKPCKYYKEGRCTKGAACTYIHDDS